MRQTKISARCCFKSESHFNYHGTSCCVTLTAAAAAADTTATVDDALELC